jgi:hypothetical protein
LLATVRKLDE